MFTISPREKRIASSEPLQSHFIERATRTRMLPEVQARIAAKAALLQQKTSLAYVVPNEPYHPTRQKFMQARIERSVENAVEQMKEAARRTTEIETYNTISEGMREATEALDREAARARSVMEIHSVGRIQGVVCRHYQISRAQMLGESRTARLVRPRHVAMYLCCELTPRSLPDIGRRFGGRDHTTVLNARQRMTAKLNTEPGFQNTIDVLTALIKACAPMPEATD